MFSSQRLLLSGIAAGLAVAALALVACGGDDDSGGEIKIGSDEDYVEAACKAQNEFFVGVLSAAFSGADADEEEQLKLIREPMEDFRNALAKARPPEDAADYHRGLLTGIEKILAAIDDGDTSALDELDFDVSEVLPETTRARLAEISAGIEACEGLGNPFNQDF